MKRLNHLSENTFLKLFFTFFSLCFLVAAFFMPDRDQMIPGFIRILCSPTKASANFFSIGGYAATFLNMGLVGLICTSLYCIPGVKSNPAATLVNILTTSFGSWGIHILNMWPTVFGVMVYCLIKKRPLGNYTNAMLFSTGLAPFISELMLRYPDASTVGFTPMGARMKDHFTLMNDPDHVKDVIQTYGNATFLLNAGFYGLYVLFYYNVIGAEFNGITFGIIFGMLSTCNAGSHPGNVWPIMTGYALASHPSQILSHLAGGTFSQPLHAQAMMVGLCFANGLTPISDKYGWRYGLFAAVLHYYMVTTVPNLHGGFCLYNGGFTANLVCILLLPILEHHFKTKQQRLDMRNSDAVLFE